MTADAALQSAMCDALDGLLDAFRLEPIGGDRFRVGGEGRRFDRVFGGQLLGQAVVAAGASIDGDLQPQSLHASFVDGAKHDEPLEIEVERVRDGRTIATRQVTVTQDGRPVLVAIASFHANSPGPCVTPPVAPAPAPEDLLTLQQLIGELSADRAPAGRPWVEHPPPLELRLPEPPSFLGGPLATTARTHWMRLPRPVDDCTTIQAALVAYASDYFLLDMAFRAHPDHAEPGSVNGTSLDHAIWFHRPARLQRWHRYTQELVVLDGQRGLVRGAIHDIDGALVASVVQEVLVRSIIGNAR